jgi:hypothetical protein
MEKGFIRNHIGTLLIRVIILIAVCILVFSAFMGHRPLLGMAFSVYALMLVYEIINISVYKRIAGTLELLPFALVFLFLIGFDYII